MEDNNNNYEVGELIDSNDLDESGHEMVEYSESGNEPFKEYKFAFIKANVKGEDANKFALDVYDRIRKTNDRIDELYSDINSIKDDMLKQHKDFTIGIKGAIATSCDSLENSRENRRDLLKIINDSIEKNKQVRNNRHMIIILYVVVIVMFIIILHFLGVIL